MQTTKLNRLLRSENHGGFYNSPLALLIADVGYRDRPRIVAMLYIKDAVRDKSGSALDKMSDSAYVASCDWFPVAINTTIREALHDLEVKVNQIKGDRKSMADWFLDLYHVQFNLTRYFDDDAEYMVDVDGLKLNAHPEYFIKKE